MTATIVQFTINDPAAPPRAFPIENLVIAGWTGRDAASVQHHVEELAALGVPGPSTVPLYYRAGRNLVTQADRIQVVGAGTSGEVEPVLVRGDDGLYVTVGSDHTDRDTESYSIAVSKQGCPKVLARAAWPFAEVADHWDQLRLTATIDGDVLYQDGATAEIRTPANLIEGYSATGDLPPGTVFMCGTVPAIGGIRASARFTMRLHDPVLDRSLTHTYHIDVLPIVS